MKRTILPGRYRADALIVFPPVSEGNAPVGPYLAGPLLASWLRSNGFSANSMDLNVRFFRWLQSGAPFERICQNAELRLKSIEAKGHLTAGDLSVQRALRTILCSYSVHDGRRLLYGMAAEDGFERFLHVGAELLAPYLRKLPKLYDDMVRVAQRRPNNILEDFYDAIDHRTAFEGVRVLGISVIFSTQLYPALAFARRVKAALGHRILIALGGPQVSLLQDHRLDELASLPFVDVLVPYDGEQPLLQLCRCMAPGHVGGFEDVPNLIWRENGTLRRSPPGDACQMSDLPAPAYEPSELWMYAAPVRLCVYVSKGCYWRRCQFCDYTKLYGPTHQHAGVKELFRPVDRVLDDIEEVTTRYDVDVRPVYLVAESIHPKYYRELAQGVIDRGLDIEMMSFMRVERAHDDEFYELLYRAGVRLLTFGVESTSDRLLALMKKGYKAETVSKSVTAAGRAGLTVRYNLIGDYPTSTLEDIEENIAFVRRHENYIASLAVGRFDLSSNSPIMSDPDAHGIVVHADRDVLRPRGLHLVDFTRTEGLSHEQIAEAFKRYDPVRRDLQDKRAIEHLGGVLDDPAFTWEGRGIAFFDDVAITEGSHYSGNRDPNARGEAVFGRSEDPVVLLYRPALRRHLVDRTPRILRRVLAAIRTDGCVWYDQIVCETTLLARQEEVQKTREATSTLFTRLARRAFVSEILEG